MNSVRTTGKWNYKARAAEMTGGRYGRLTVQARAGSDGNGRAQWLCRCDCGKDRVYLRQVLIAGEAISCGCAKLGNTNGLRRVRRTTHNDGGALLAATWA